MIVPDDTISMSTPISASLIKNSPIAHEVIQDFDNSFIKELIPKLG
jgi:hypothetical protein